MKEKILKAIKDKLGKTGLSEMTIEKKAERLAKSITTDELMTEEVIGEAVDDLKDIEGQFNHDVAEAVNTQVAEKLRLEKLRLEKPETKEVETGMGETGMSEEMRAEIAGIKALRAELEAEKATRQKDSFRKSVSEALERQGSTDEFYREYVMLKFGLDDAKSVDDNVALLKSKYDDTVSERSANCGVPYSGAYVPAEVDKAAREAAIKADVEKMNIKC